jgi:hypothetical protein
MTGKIQKYSDASLYALTRVIDAADRLYASTAEFPDDPACWSDHMEALDSALEGCPGTSAYYHAKRRRENNPSETITVCSACLQASCWQGIFYCDDYKTAGTVEKTRADLEALALESSDYWTRDSE